MSGGRIREALLYDRCGERVECRNCERRCILGEEEMGFCATRKKLGGRLYTLEYGEISSLSANPIEKKPFFHFHPGTRALTIGSWSCNFTCPWCQNHAISKSPGQIGKGRYISPEELVGLARSFYCQGTSVSFNEPTLLLEYSLDLFDFSKRHGLYNTLVSNGYMTKEALQLLSEHGLDAVNFDLKGEREAVRSFCGADVGVVWRNAVEARRKGIWLELTTLVIPGVNDSEDELKEMARRIRRELGEEVPWHLSAYHPDCGFNAPPTPTSTLDAAKDMAKAEGLKYVYVGNVPGHPGENTYCPHCNELLIERRGFNVTGYGIKDGHCPRCGEEIPVIQGLACEKSA